MHISKKNYVASGFIRCVVVDLPGRLALTGISSRKAASTSSEARRWRLHRGLEGSSMLGSSR